MIIINLFKSIDDWLTPRDKDIMSKRVILCFDAKSDKKGALNRPPFIYKITRTDKTDIEIVHKVVRSIEDINQFSKKFKEQNNTLNGLVIRAHANSHGLKLSSRTKYSDTNHSTINPRNVDLLKPTFSLLEKEAPIILEGCSAGSDKDGFSIAEKISDSSLKRVYAATETLCSIGAKYTLNQAGISVKFTAKFYDKGTSIRSRINNIIYRILFSFGCLEREILKVFHPKNIS